MILEPVTLVTNEKVDVEVLHEIGGADEHLVAHDQDRVSGVLDVLPDLGALKQESNDTCSMAFSNRRFRI